MKVWIDAQLPPALAQWLVQAFRVESVAVRDLGLRDATDVEIFEAGRKAQAVIMTKDADFVALLEQRGAPPKIVWLTCGNTSNARLREVLARTWPQARVLLDAGEPLVEVNDEP